MERLASVVTCWCRGRHPHWRRTRASEGSFRLQPPLKLAWSRS